MTDFRVTSGPAPALPDTTDDGMYVTFAEIVSLSAQDILTGSLRATTIISSSNYVAGSAGFMLSGDGDAEFNDVTVRGDIISANWDGTVPLSLPDAAATQGFALQSSNGAAQFAGSLDIGGSTTLGGSLDVSGSLTFDEDGCIVFDRASDTAYGSITWNATNLRHYYEVWDDPVIFEESTVAVRYYDIVNDADIASNLFEYRRPTGAPATYDDWYWRIGLDRDDVDGSYLKFDVTGLSYPQTGNVTLSAEDSLDLVGTDVNVTISGTDIASFGNGASYPGLSLTRPIQTGQTSYTRRPWNKSTICLGNYAYVGTPGSYMGGIWWNWERGTDSGYYSLSVNGFTSAYGVLLGDGGILFVGDDPWGETGTPTTRMTLTGAGDLTLHTGDLSVNGSISGASLGVTGAISGASLSVTGLASASSAMRSNVFEFASDTDTQISYSSSGIGNFYSNGTIVGQWGSAGLFSRTLTTSNSPNVYMSSSSLSAHYRFTSAAKYKTQVTDEQDYLASLTLRPVKFYREDSDSWHYGYIADELVAQDELFGVYDEKGEIESYDWIEIIAVLGAKVNRADARIEKLERTIVKGASR